MFFFGLYNLKINSKSLRQKVGVWITQFARGINVMLMRAVVGIKEYFKDSRKKLENEIIITQLSLQI